MQRYPIMCVAAILLSCSKPNSDNKIHDSNTLSLRKDSITAKVEGNNTVSYLPSTYDYAGDAIKQHQASLKALSDSLVFSTIHNLLFTTLSKKHQRYFTFNPYYELLYYSAGDIFQNRKDDHAFIVFDKTHVSVVILVYDEFKNKYAELYRQAKVNNGLENAECNYGSSGTLDYQVANELIYQNDYLLKKPESYLEYAKCKILDIAKDTDMVLESGCFAANFSADMKLPALCISTSAVYNNWECLTYNKIKDEFIAFYSQAFAD